MGGKVGWSYGTARKLILLVANLGSIPSISMIPCFLPREISESVKSGVTSEYCLRDLKQKQRKKRKTLRVSNFGGPHTTHFDND